MYALGFWAYVAACFLAPAATIQPHGRRVAFWVAGIFVVGWAGLVLGVWALSGLPDPFPDPKWIQLGLVGLYGLAYGLLPAGILRPRAHDPRSARTAFFLAALAPWLGWTVFALVGNGRRAVSEGMGNLADLLFLNPIAMGEGVTREGFITHRYQIHYVALGVIVLFALALQFLPVQPVDDSELPRKSVRADGDNG